jgi:hypothetical protein
MTLKPRYAKKVSATLAMMSENDGYPLKARRSKSMSTSVTAMKTAKTASRTTTIRDCARSTTREPTRLTRPPDTTAVVKTLSHQPAASSPTKSDVA